MRRQLRAGGIAGRYACSVSATGLRLGLGGMQGSRRTQEFVVRAAVHVTFDSNEVEVGVARSASAVQWARARSEATGGWPVTLAATVVRFPHLRLHQVATAGRGARRDRMAMGTR